MNKVLSAIILILAVFLLMPNDAQSQSNMNVNNMKTIYSSTVIKKDTAYVANQKDTSWTILGAGGADYITFVVTVKDTCLMDYYIDYQVVGLNTAWTNGLTDSLINNGATSNSGATKEFIWRNHTVEKYGGLYYYIRTRKSFRNVTQGVSTATYKETLMYKP